VQLHSTHHASCPICFLLAAAHITQHLYTYTALSKVICPQSFCQQFEIMPGYFPCQLACCCFPAAKMQHCEEHESPIWHHHNAWQHSLVYMKGSLQVPQECPQEVADLVDACLDLCADRRPTADDITDVIYQSAQANSSVLEG